jgi:broad specificity phosphatase PhoE
LKQAGIGRIAFLRHGNAPSVEGAVDFDRLLTEKGREQAEEAGRSFGKRLKPFFPLVLVSSSPRTVSTAQNFLEAADAVNSATIRKEAILYDGTMQPGGSALFRRIGYTALRDYINSNNEEDRALSRRLVGGYAHNVMQTMMTVVQETQPPHPAGQSTMLIVGHALYLPAVVLGVASMAGCSQKDQDLILDDKVQEAQGYLVDIVTPSVSILERPN